jgi:hypothetical protein
MRVPTCGALTPLASSLSTSLPLKTIYGSQVFLVVFTVIFPWTRSSSHASPTFSSDEVTEDQTERRYGSRYLGKSRAKEDSSVKGRCESAAGAGKASIAQ